MVGIRQFISKWLAREANDRRLPSLVRALQRVAPHSVVKEVVGTSSDRRQWGVLTAAWLGVSERELTRAVAQEMKREFVERLPRLALEELAGDKRALLEQMRDIGLVPIFDGPAIVKYIAVDPAEVRGFTLYTGRETVSIGCWSDISRILDDASRELQSEDDTREYQLQRQHQELCMKVVELLIHEARSHGARTLELVSVEEGIFSMPIPYSTRWSLSSIRTGRRGLGEDSW
jgi:hypothetical protein